MKVNLTALRPPLRSPAFWLGVAGLCSILWAYWGTLHSLAETWAHSPHYAHGFLVPAFAVAILWFRREQLKAEAWRSSAWGLPLLLAGGLLRLAGAYFYYPWFDALSLLPSLAGLLVLVGGAQALRWAWPAVAFLLFMLPLPFMAEGALAHPLQRFATLASTYVLQTVGFPALAEGNIVVLNESRIGVVEACNGLGMLVIFFAVATTVAFVVKRPLWEKLAIVASAVPIALLANVARISVTAVLSETAGPWIAHAVFHDWGGWLMMPLALLLLWVELRLLSRLLVMPAAAPAAPLAWVGPALHRSPAPAGAKGKRRGKHRPKAKVPAPPKA